MIAIAEAYRRLSERYGPQHWWPADTPFEVMVGAVLTQNAAWTNVEKAIANLRQEGLLAGPQALGAVSEADLAPLLRPVGYFNVKARRLLNLCRFLVDNGSRLPAMTDLQAREALLAINGVGPETADDILLYAYGRPVFVVDAYTRRLGERLGWLAGKEAYDAVRLMFERELGQDPVLFNEYHALIVRHAKEHCRKRPLCCGCPLSVDCVAASA